MKKIPLLQNCSNLSGVPIPQNSRGEMVCIDRCHVLSYRFIVFRRRQAEMYTFLHSAISMLPVMPYRSCRTRRTDFGLGQTKIRRAVGVPVQRLRLIVRFSPGDSAQEHRFEVLVSCGKRVPDAHT